MMISAMWVLVNRYGMLLGIHMTSNAEVHITLRKGDKMIQKKFTILQIESAHIDLIEREVMEMIGQLKPLTKIGAGDHHPFGKR